MTTQIHQLLDAMAAQSDRSVRLAVSKELFRLVKSGGQMPGVEGIIKKHYAQEADTAVAAWLLKALNHLKTVSSLGFDPLPRFQVELSLSEQAEVLAVVEAMTTAVIESDGIRVQVFEETYNIGPVIGSGGMGQIHQAVRRDDCERVAIKFIRPEYANSPSILARFEREYATLKASDHDNVIQVFDWGVKDDRPYFVMEYLTGGSLWDRRRQGPMSPNPTLEWFAHICHALDYVHGRGMVHRDIKPANILLTDLNDQAVAKLTDFGLVRLDDQSGLTKTSDTMGTDIFTSPEQWINPINADPRSDIYSLAASLVYVLCDHELNQDNLLDAAWSLVDLPDQARQAILNCLNRDPDRRIQKASRLGYLLSASPDGDADDHDQTMVISPQD